MARASRHIIPGQVWHLTHRCHEKKWLLRFAKDRRRWLYWLYQARKRYGLTVLNYVVTCNHIHLLVKDNGHGEIWRSMQLVAGRTAQEYNNRKGRRGAFWEDRYHSTAVETDAHLHRCITYIDLNMVRARAVGHPEEWVHGGYAEMLNPRKRYTYVDEQSLFSLLGMSSLRELQFAREKWVGQSIRKGDLSRKPEWSESVAVGGESYIRSLLPFVQHSNPGRKCVNTEGAYALRELRSCYNAFSS